MNRYSKTGGSNFVDLCTLALPAILWHPAYYQLSMVMVHLLTSPKGPFVYYVITNWLGRGDIIMSTELSDLDTVTLLLAIMGHKIDFVIVSIHSDFTKKTKSNHLTGFLLKSYVNWNNILKNSVRVNWGPLVLYILAPAWP